MTLSRFFRSAQIFVSSIAFAILAFPGVINAQWQLGLGAETPDMGTQGLSARYFHPPGNIQLSLLASFWLGHGGQSNRGGVNFEQANLLGCLR
jgi:hypothetical protein